MKFFLLAIITLLAGSCGSRAASDGGRATAAAGGDAPAGELYAPAMRFSGDSARSLVVQQLECGPRVPGSAGHDACRALISTRLAQYGADSVWTHTSSAERFDGAPMPVANIIARFNPEASHRILLAAHYDTRPWADSDDDPAMHSRPIPGANDGASGAAVLLEIARCLAEERPQTGVDLVFLDGEDSGTSDPLPGDGGWCLGSRQWMASRPYGVAAMPRYGILLDMVGGRGAKFYHEYFSHVNAPEPVMKIWRAARALGYADFFPAEQRGAVNDDHIYLSAGGIPTADIIECAHPATGSFPPYWHTMGDDIDIIDAATLEAVGRTVLAVVYAEEPSR